MDSVEGSAHTPTYIADSVSSVSCNLPSVLKNSTSTPDFTLSSSDFEGPGALNLQKRELCELSEGELRERELWA